MDIKYLFLMNSLRKGGAEYLEQYQKKKKIYIYIIILSDFLINIYIYK